MITRLEFFLENKALETINEAALHFSRRLEAALDKLEEDDDEIAAKLLFSAGKDLGPDITLIDFDDSKEGYFSFTTERHLKKNIASMYPERDEEWLKDVLYNTSRIRSFWDSTGSDFVTSPQSVRIGKLINRLFPGQFSDKQREEFINKLKVNLENYGEKMELVDGDDIRYWYDGEKYAIHKGPLWSSCMKDDDFFDIYAYNPEVCKLLILTEQGKLKGRALVWKVNHEKFEWFMDRQYCSLDYDVEKFRKWARDHGWAYRATNSIHQPRSVYFNGKADNIALEVKLKPLEYRTFPYMDTFKSYYPDENILRNMEDDEGCYILQSTEGSYDDRMGVYSEYYDRRISSDHAVWSNVIDDYLDIRHAVHVSAGSRRNQSWYPDDHEDIVYDEISNQWLHRDDAVWCEAFGSYYLMDETFEVIESVDKNLNYNLSFIPDFKPHDSANEDDLWYKLFLSKHSNIEDYFFLESNMVHNYKRNLIPKSLRVNVFEEILLTQEHARHLGFEIPKSKTIIMDLVEYNTFLKDKGYLEKLDGVDEDVRPDLVYNKKTD